MLIDQTKRLSVLERDADRVLNRQLSADVRRDRRRLLVDGDRTYYGAIRLLAEGVLRT
jgi:hypothetical protein